MKLIEMEKVLSELCLSHKDIIYIDKNETAERIRKIPSIDIDPKRGEWKIEETESVWGKGYMLTCSECGDTFRVTENALSHEHFCRNCGADMRNSSGKPNNSTSSKMEQVEPQLTPNYCGTCKHREVSCGDLPCDVCHGYSNYEPKDDPQTDCAWSKCDD